MLLFACSCSGAAKLVALQRGLAARVQRGRFEEPGETLKCLRHHTVHPEETSGKMSGLTTLCWESSFTSWLLSTRHPCWRQLPEARAGATRSLKLFGGARLLPARPAAGLAGVVSHCAAGDFCALQLI